MMRAALMLCVLLLPASAQKKTAPKSEPFNPERAQIEVGIDQRLGESLPLDLVFSDEHGRALRLGELFGERPVILALVYYECRTLCTEVLNGTARLMRAMSLVPGRDFELVCVSIDPGETPAIAAKAKARHMIDVEGSDAGCHFLVGDEPAIDALAAAVGFRYVYYPESGEYAHGSAICVATSKGRLSHYFYGIEYTPKDVRLALVEASQGRIGSLVDALLLLCFHYDPTSGKYGLAIVSVLRIAGVATVAALVAYMLMMLRRERRVRTVEAGL